MTADAELSAQLKAAQAGDVQAVEGLLVRFAPLVKAVARRYRRIAHADALQEGYVALLACIHAYRPELGVPFAGFVRRQVWGQVRSAMRKEWRCRMRQQSPAGTGTHAGAVAARGSATHGPAPSGVAPGRGQSPACDTRDDGYAMAELRLWMDQAGLTEREQAGVKALLAGWTCAELATAWGVGEETAKTWRKRGLRKLRHSLEAEQAPPGDAPSGPGRPCGPGAGVRPTQRGCRPLPPASRPRRHGRGPGPCPRAGGRCTSPSPACPQDESGRGNERDRSRQT